jgi:pimeloyl-ACP methyl ester carboxylesterase
MSNQQTNSTAHSVETASGRISYISAGSGPVALFVHGVILNKHLWRHQLAGLSDIRCCIAVDLLAHGATEIAPDQDVSVTANAKMLKEVLDALKIEQVDLVGNDSGGGIAQIFAALHPERVRTLTLTNCDTHDNWPPEAFKPFVDMVKAGGLRHALNAMLADKRSIVHLARLGRAMSGLGASRTKTLRTISGLWCGPNSAPATCSASLRLSTTSTRGGSNLSCANYGLQPSSPGRRMTSTSR